MGTAGGNTWTRQKNRQKTEKHQNQIENEIAFKKSVITQNQTFIKYTEIKDKHRRNRKLQIQKNVKVTERVNKTKNKY